MEEKNYLILEQSSFGDINHFQDGNAYILEGIFAKFDNKQNQNGRIYKEEDYLPQLEELQEQIKEGNLLGQIDHPEKVETSLAKASHVIEKLEYDSKEHVVRGRIRLLSGFYGQLAKDLINDGVQLSISSRALGKVRNDKTVDLQKIITYDLVANPGFKDAKLSRTCMNESLGILNENVGIFSIDFPEEIKENRNTKIISDADLPKLKLSEMSKMFKNNEDSERIVKKNNEDVAYIKKYLDYLVEQINNLDSPINNKGRNYNSNGLREISKLQEDINNIKEYLDYNAGHINKMEKYLDYSANKTNKIEEFLDYTSNHINKIEDYLDYSAKNQDKMEEYLDYTSNHINKMEKYLDYSADNVNKVQEYLDYSAKNINNIEDYLDYSANNVNNIERYLDYSADNINKVQEYLDYSANNFNEFSGKYEAVNESDIYGIRNNDNKSKSIKQIKDNFDYIMENVKNKKQQKIQESNIAPYLSLLDYQKQREFSLLDNNLKQKITDKILEYKPVNESQLLNIWNKEVEPMNEQDSFGELLRYIPKNLEPVYENLNESTKQRIMNESKLWDLSSERNKRNFWLSRKSLFESEIQDANLNHTSLINESKDYQNNPTNNGFKNDYMRRIMMDLDRLNG